MLTRTHFILSVFILLLIYPQITNPLTFSVFFLIAAFFPDIDSRNSRFGKSIFLRPLQWIISHRGVFHSIFALSIFSALIYTFNANAAIGFFLGYLFHLFLDAMTIQGIKPFYPLLNLKISFILKSGSIIEEIIFILFLIFDIFLIIKIIY
jgi:inner membrane protein